jgi:hypothetical protein
MPIESVREQCHSAAIALWHEVGLMRPRGFVTGLATIEGLAFVNSRAFAIDGQEASAAAGADFCLRPKPSAWIGPARPTRLLLRRRCGSLDQTAALRADR